MTKMLTACGLNPAEYSLRLVCLGSRPGKKGFTIDPPWVGGHPVVQHELWHIFDGVGDIREERGEWRALEPGMLLWLKKGRFYETRQDPATPSGIAHFGFEMIDAQGQIADSDIAKDVPLIVNNVAPSFCEMTTRRILELHWEVYIDAQQSPEEFSESEVPETIFWDDQNAFRRSRQGPIYTRMHSPPEHSTLQLNLADTLLRSLVMEYLRLAENGNRADCAGVSKRHLKIINNLVCNIRADISNAPSVEEMAKSCGYSMDHFCRIFRNYMRKTPQEYITEVRMLRARELLLNSELSVKEIAAEAGYSTSGFFSRQFRAKTSMSPKEFRKRHRSSALA